MSTITNITISITSINVTRAALQATSASYIFLLDAVIILQEAEAEDGIEEEEEASLEGEHETSDVVVGVETPPLLSMLVVVCKPLEDTFTIIFLFFWF